MTKAELVAVVKEEAGITKDQANAAVEAVVTAAVNSLKPGNSGLALKGFASFSVQERPARTGRNPKTGEPLEIGAKRIPKVKFSSEVKKILNETAAPAKKAKAAAVKK